MKCIGEMLERLFACYNPMCGCDEDDTEPDVVIIDIPPMTHVTSVVVEESESENEEVVECVVECVMEAGGGKVVTPTETPMRLEHVVIIIEESNNEWIAL